MVFARLAGGAWLLLALALGFLTLIAAAVSVDAIVLLLPFATGSAVLGIALVMRPGRRLLAASAIAGAAMATLAGWSAVALLLSLLGLYVAQKARPQPS